MESEKTNGHVLNIGRGNPITIHELAHKVIAATKQQGKLQPVLMGNDAQYIKHRAPDVTKMVELLGFSAPTSLEDGLKKMVEYYES